MDSELIRVRKKQRVNKKTIRMTDMQKEACRARLAGYSPKDAMIAAGYTHVSQQAVWKFKNNAACNAYMREMMIAGGLTPELLVDKLREGLESTITKTATSDGKITDTLEVKDMKTRLDYVKYTASLLRVTPPRDGSRDDGVTPQAPQTQAVQVNVNMPNMPGADATIEELQEFMQRRREEVRKGGAGVEPGTVIVDPA